MFQFDIFLPLHVCWWVLSSDVCGWFIWRTKNVVTFDFRLLIEMQKPTTNIYCLFVRFVYVAADVSQFPGNKKKCFKTIDPKRTLSGSRKAKNAEYGKAHLPHSKPLVFYFLFLSLRMWNVNGSSTLKTGYHHCHYHAIKIKKSRDAISREKAKRNRRTCNKIHVSALHDLQTAHKRSYAMLFDIRSSTNGIYPITVWCCYIR